MPGAYQLYMTYTKLRSSNTVSRDLCYWHYFKVIHDGTLLDQSYLVLASILMSGFRINLLGDFDFNNTTVENISSPKYVVQVVISSLCLVVKCHQTLCLSRSRNNP